jgi:hypothetical protein
VRLDRDRRRKIEACRRRRDRGTSEPAIAKINLRLLLVEFSIKTLMQPIIVFDL